MNAHPTAPSALSASAAPSGPLHIDRVVLGAASAAPDATSATCMIGMTHCPGRTGTDGRGRVWRRTLSDDVQAIRASGFTTVLSLLPDAELQALGAGALGEALREAGLRWVRFPIADFGVPDATALVQWQALQPQLIAQLQAGQPLLVHCAAGLGRTGTMVAALLKALGDDSASAIARVRAARPGTIETEGQKAFVVAFQPG